MKTAASLEISASRTFDAFAEKQLWFYRISLLFPAVLAPGMGLVLNVLHPEVNNLMPIRWALCAAYSLLIAASFVRREFQERIMFYAMVMSFVTMLSYIGQLVLTDFTVDHVLVYIMLFLVYGIIFPNTKALAYFVGMGAILGIGTIFMAHLPEVSPAMFTIVTATVASVTYLFVGLRNSIQNRLTLSEKMMESVFQESTDTLLLFDQNGTIARYNERAVQLFLPKLSPKTADLPLQLKASIPAEVRDALETLQYSDFQDKEIAVELNGQKSWLDVAGKRIALSGTVFFLVRIFDITFRKEAEEERMEYTGELERMNKLMVGRELKMREMKERMESVGK